MRFVKLSGSPSQNSKSLVRNYVGSKGALPSNRYVVCVYEITYSTFRNTTNGQSTMDKNEKLHLSFSVVKDILCETQPTSEPIHLR